MRNKQLRNQWTSALLAVSLGATSLAAPLANAASPNVEAAINAALEGPEKKKLSLFGHSFNVKQATVWMENGKIRIKGQLSHRNGWTDGIIDDQVYYSFAIKGEEDLMDGELVGDAIRIKDGGWSALGRLIVSIGGLLGFGEKIEELKEKFPFEDIPVIIQSLEQEQTEGWKAAAIKTAVIIALEGYHRNAPKNMYLASNSMFGGSRGYDVTLRTNLGKYMAAEGGGGREINANRNRARSYETLRLVDLNGGWLKDGDTVRIGASNGKFLASCGNASQVYASGTRYSFCGQFYLDKLSGSSGKVIKPGDKIAVRTRHGRYFSTVGMNGRVNSEPIWVRAWEEFTIGYTPKLTSFLPVRPIRGTRLAH